MTGSTCERCTNQLQGLPSGAERVLPGPAPLVEESGVVYGSVRVVSSLTTTHLQAGVQAHLRLVGGGVHTVLFCAPCSPAAYLLSPASSYVSLPPAEERCWRPIGARA